MAWGRWLGVAEDTDCARAIEVYHLNTHKF